MIGLGAILNLQLGGILGAVAFSLGLFTVCVLQLDLFTGKFGAVLKSDLKPIYLPLIFAGNLLGILMMVGISTSLPNFSTIQANAQAIMASRLNIPWWAMMWKNHHHPFSAMLPIAAFVILGGAHCIADIFYFSLGGETWQIVQIFEVIIGNFIGASLFSIASQGN